MNHHTHHWARRLAPCLLAFLVPTGAAQAGEAMSLRGVAAVGGPLAQAAITVTDSRGQVRRLTADAQGAYELDARGLQAPLMIMAVEAGQQNCSDSARPWAKCLGALKARLEPGENIANVNPLSDRVLSMVAERMSRNDPALAGPQALLDRRTAEGIPVQEIELRTAQLRPLIAPALVAAGLDAAEAARFDPVGTPMRADHQGIDAVLEVLVHNRGYDNDSGAPGGTMLLDADYRYVGQMDAGSTPEPLDYPTARAALARNRDPAYTRVLIVGDSTASTYERARAPREGWGQVFEGLFRPEARIRVLNGAKSGRSSRNFFNQGYFSQMAQYLRPGDYVIIHHGHNDQNCDASKARRGAADVANLCTYPNDANGERQFPAGHPELSFQYVLETYVKLAREKGAIPILMTPTTRVKNAQGMDGGFPVAPRHATRQNAAQGYAFVGDYSATIRKTAADNAVPLIDIEARTIAFANAHEADWKGYWLAVDPAKYPWYASQTSGTLAKPDTTHFQHAGALAVAHMVADGLRDTPALAKLAAALR